MERLEEVSGGRIEVEIFLADELVTQDEIVPALQDGTIDITHNVMQLINAPIDLVEVTGCPPFTTDNGPEMDVLFEERGLNELFEEAWAEVDGITWLDSGSYDPTNLITTEPITSFEDLDGLKLHGPVGIYNILKEAGVVMTTVPWEEIYMSAQTGILDGIAWCGATEGYNCSWYEVMPYFLTNPVCGSWECSFLVNTNSWNELPPDLQEMWLMAIDAWNYKRQVWYFAGESHHRTSPSFNLTTMPHEDWARVRTLKEAEYDRIAAVSPRCAEAIRIIRDYHAELEAAGPPYRYSD
jgi:TRAP-type mannitol/chloroaromatic compound transport system substrate-binding protein